MALSPTTSRGGAAPTIVTSLPAGAATGDEVHLQVGSGDSAILWHMRYDATITDAFKWRFLGGPALFNRKDTATFPASGTYVTQDASTPQVTLPAVGIYRVAHGCKILMATGSTDYGLASVMTNGVTPPDDTDAIECTIGVVNKDATVATNFVRTVASIATSALLVQVYRSAGNPSFNFRWLAVWPVRL